MYKFSTDATIAAILIDRFNTRSFWQYWDPSYKSDDEEIHTKKKRNTQNNDTLLSTTKMKTAEYNKAVVPSWAMNRLLGALPTTDLASVVGQYAIHGPYHFIRVDSVKFLASRKFRFRFFELFKFFFSLRIFSIRGCLNCWCQTLRYGGPT